MKLHRLFIFAIMIFAATTAFTQNAAAQKASRNWMVFTGHQAVVTERSSVAPKYTCASSIYGTANFASPVDLADGFYVTIAANGEMLIQEKMTVDGKPGVRRNIPVDIIPDDNAELGFPAASLDYSHALLTELKPGVHTITVAVSVGEGNSEVISAGSFTFDNRRGCAERFERIETLINGTGTAEAETEEPEAEPTEDDTPVAPTRLQTPTSSPGNNRNYIDFFNGCSEDKVISYQHPDGTFSVIRITSGFPYSSEFPVGTKFWRGNTMGGEPFHILPASQYTNEMDKARSAQKFEFCK